MSYNHLLFNMKYTIVPAACTCAHTEAERVPPGRMLNKGQQHTQPEPTATSTSILAHGNRWSRKLKGPQHRFSVDHKWQTHFTFPSTIWNNEDVIHCIEGRIETFTLYPSIPPSSTDAFSIIPSTSFCSCPFLYIFSCCSSQVTKPLQTWLFWWLTAGPLDAATQPQPHTHTCAYQRPTGDFLKVRMLLRLFLYSRLIIKYQLHSRKKNNVWK